MLSHFPLNSLRLVRILGFAHGYRTKVTPSEAFLDLVVL